MIKHMSSLRAKLMVLTMSVAMTTVIITIVYFHNIAGQMVADENGMIIAHTHNTAFLPTIQDTQMLYTTMADVEAYRQFLEANPFEAEPKRVHGYDGIDRYMVFQEIETTGWLLHKSMPAHYVVAPANALTLVSSLILGIVILLAAFINYFIINKLIVKPVRSLSKATHHTEEERHDMPLAYVDEISEISNTIKDAETKERKAKELAQMYLDYCPLFIEVWDSETQISSVNEQTAAVFGLEDKNDFITRHAEFMPEFQPCGTPSYDKISEIINKALKYGILETEFMHKTATGEPLPVETTLVRMKRDEKDIVVIYSRDMRQINAARDRERSEEMRRLAAEEANRAKSDFLAKMSHEIRTPMNVII